MKKLLLEKKTKNVFPLKKLVQSLKISKFVCVVLVDGPIHGQNAARYYDLVSIKKTTTAHY